MNINYHLTEEEARDGLNGLLPKRLKGVVPTSILFAALAVTLIVRMALSGFQVIYAVFAVLGFALSLWFLFNRQLRLYFVSRRSSAKDNMYMLIVSPEGWIRTKDGKKVKLHGDSEAMAVETPLTISIRPDSEHQYVIPKTVLKGGRVEELCGILEASGCPVKR